MEYYYLEEVSNILDKSNESIWIWWFQQIDTNEILIEQTSSRKVYDAKKYCINPFHLWLIISSFHTQYAPSIINGCRMIEEFINNMTIYFIIIRESMKWRQKIIIITINIGIAFMRWGMEKIEFSSLFIVIGERWMRNRYECANVGREKGVWGGKKI